MYSLVVLFSNDRLRQLNIMHDCWAYLTEEFDSCEKILCVDGKLDVAPIGNWNVLEIARTGPFYCWANTLNAGIQAATRPFVLYYDSDRIIPKGHVQFCLETLFAQDAYVYSERLYGLTKDLGVQEFCDIVHNPDPYIPATIYPDFRVSDPNIYERKNPFAGGVAFRRETFLRHGGFDPRFVGYGYPDFDFFQNTTRQGVTFVKSPYIELHERHPYRPGAQMVEYHNAWNCWQYVLKWNLDRTFVDAFWKRLQIPLTARKAGNLGEFLSCF